MPLDLPETFSRLPVYMIIDTSSSMEGAPIVALNDGLKIFETIVKEDPFCRESAFISVIRFSSDAEVALELTEVESFQAPTFSAHGGTALSKALRKLRKFILITEKYSKIM